MSKPAAVYGLLSVLFIGALSRFGGQVATLELQSYDFLMRVIRGPIAPPRDVVIVAIDESSIAEFGKDFGWPWPRHVHAALIKRLAAEGARAIVFDVVFDLPSQPAEDQALADAIHTSRIPIVLAASIDTTQDEHGQIQQRLMPLPLLAGPATTVGFATIEEDIDKALRRAPVTVIGTASLASAALTASGYPPASGDEVLINFAGPGRTIKTVSYYQAIEADTALPKGLFAGKTVFVGRSVSLQELAAGASQSDLYRTPFDLNMPGVEVHANAFNTLAHHLTITRAGPLVSWTLVVLLTLGMTALVNAPISVRAKSAAALGFVTLVPVVAAMAFVSARYWVHTVQPMLILISVFGLNTLHQFRASERERAYVRKALQGYVSKQVLQRLLDNPSALDLGGVLVEGTVLFADIVGFSSIAERTPPRELTALLNEYFTEMGEAVMHEDGLVDKYIGDAIMAVWGAPLADARHAVRACAAALAMRRAVVALGGPMQARIGVSSGTMMAGNLGHRARMQYTVIGDTVNLASRLEGANKVYGTGIVVSDSTKVLAEKDFVFRRLDRIRVVGKQQPVVIHELLGGIEDTSRWQQPPRLEAYGAILAAYDAGQWSAAHDSISRYRALFPEVDPVVDVYEERCRTFEASPPPADWDGVYTATTK